MSYNLYVKTPIDDRENAISYEKIKEVILVTEEKEIHIDNFNIRLDPAEFVFENLAEDYIFHCVEDELKPLFKEKQEEIAEYLYDKSDLVDSNWVIDVMNNYDIK